MSNHINKYLVSSFILIGIFVILTIVIYYDLGDKTTENNIVFNFDAVSQPVSNTPDCLILDQIMEYLSEYGREYFWIPVLITMFLFGGKDGKKVALILLFAFIIVIPLNIVTKELVDRDRPFTSNGEFITKLPTSPDKSYPSGHASMVLAGATTVLLFFSTSRRQKLISFFLVVEAAMVCISRLYLGVHYPSDVIAGILLGSGISLLVASNHKILERLINIYWVNKQH